jgi:hypothetical protein
MIHRTLDALLLVCGSVLLASCVATGPYPGVPILGASAPPLYKGPVVAPQVVYRIDENRYFEVVPDGESACDAPVYFVDKANDVRSYVLSARSRGGNDLVIDAANTQYLVAPMIKGGGSCYTCGSSWLPYSTDGGRTWKQGPAFSADDPLSVSGSEAHTIGDNATRSIDLTKNAFELKDWNFAPKSFRPQPLKPPLDTKFRCVPNGKE